MGDASLNPPSSAPQTCALVVPIVFNADASGDKSLTLYADTLSDTIQPTHEVTLNVPVRDLEAMFTYVSSEANSAHGALGYHPDSLDLDMRGAPAASATVSGWYGAFDYARNVAAQNPASLVPARAATDDASPTPSNVPTPYGYWAAWLSNNPTANVFADVDANDDILSAETNSFGQSPLFGDDGVLHTVNETASAALAAFFRNAAAHGKIGMDTQANASIGEGANVESSPAHHLTLIEGDSLVVFVKYSLSYSLGFSINQEGASDILDPSFSSEAAAGPGAVNSLSMIINGALRTLSNVEDNKTVIYKMNFVAV